MIQGSKNTFVQKLDGQFGQCPLFERNFISLVTIAISLSSNFGAILSNFSSRSRMLFRLEQSDDVFNQLTSEEISFKRIMLNKFRQNSMDDKKVPARSAIYSSC
uniref:Uncharacterized protein n=1 Tax=Romanomermis culicivorax TaxID=13658 RepID=A0A915J2I2_ROMCU